MSLRSGSPVWDGDKQRLLLGKLVKSGGAGSVFLLPESPRQVAKIYHPGDEVRIYERKVMAMLGLTPELPDLVDGAQRFVQIAWPQSPLRDERGRFLGFLMPAVDVKATSELEVILQERQARAAGLPTGLGAKVTLAANLAAVIAALHKQHHYIVDLKPVNLRFYRESLYMAMLDCDGFSIQGQGERFHAQQFTPDYLAPEFHAHGVAKAGEQSQDRFALAVVVFQLMNFGIHPFAGRPASDRVPTDIPGRIAGRWYAYGQRPNTGIAPSPVSGHAAMPLLLRQLFDRAFEGNGDARPSAAEWADTLSGFAQRASQRVLVCGKDKAHQHFAGQACAACARADLLKDTAKAAARRPRAQAGAFNTGPRRPLPSPPPAWRPGQAMPRPGTARRGVGWTGRTATYPASPPTPPGWPPVPTRARPAPTTPPPSLILQLLAWVWNNTTVKQKFNFVVLLFVLFVMFGKDLFGDNDDNQATRQQQRQDVASMPDSFREPEAAPDIERRVTLSGELLDTHRRIELAASAARSHSGLTLQRLLERLRLDARGLPPEGASTPEMHVALQREFDLPVTPLQRARYRAALEDLLDTDPYADAVAHELGWQYLLSGNAADATRCFTQSIRANPDRGAAWYGLGVATAGDEGKVGRMAVAEVLFRDADAADKVRLAFATHTLAANQISAGRFDVLQARARRAALLINNQLVPPDIEARAAYNLPPEN